MHDRPVVVPADVRELPLPRCPRYRSLDMWRGVACLLIVIYHSTLVHLASRADTAKMHPPGLVASIVASTHYLKVGVPIFFVISGYCISAAADAARRRPQPIRSYFTRRFRRIYPPFWGVVILTALFVGVVDCLFPGSLSSQPVPYLRPWWYSGWQWLGNLTLTETWRHHLIGGPRGHFPGHDWTLCYEEQFYAIMGLLLVIAPRRLFAAVTCVTFGVILAVLLGRAGMPIDGFFFDGSWFLFAAGIIVYYKVNYARRITSRVINGFFLAGFLYVLLEPIPFAAFDHDQRVTSIAAFGTALLFSVVHRWDSHFERVTMLRPLAFCGKICYSLYLIHPPLVRYIGKSFQRLGVQGDFATLALTMPVSIAISIAAAWAFYILVERRFLNSVGGDASQRSGVRPSRNSPTKDIVPSATGRYVDPGSMAGVPNPVIVS